MTVGHRGTGWRWRVSPLAALASAACLATGLFAARLVQDEWLAVAAAQAVQSGSATLRDTMLEAYGDRPAAPIPPRTAASLAQLAINAANADTTPALHALNVERARVLIDRLRERRPDWDATYLLIAQRELLEHRTATRTALAAVATSFRLRPFCAACARWRIAFACLYWGMLDPATRRAAIEEAVWQTRYDNGRRPAIEALLGDSPAAVAYQLRMGDVGHGGNIAPLR